VRFTRIDGKLPNVALMAISSYHWRVTISFLICRLSFPRFHPPRRFIQGASFHFSDVFCKGDFPHAPTVDRPKANATAPCSEASASRNVGDRRTDSSPPCDQAGIHLSQTFVFVVVGAVYLAFDTRFTLWELIDFELEHGARRTRLYKVRSRGRWSRFATAARHWRIPSKAWSARNCDPLTNANQAQLTGWVFDF